jgi:hypothetical protein
MTTQRSDLTVATQHSKMGVWQQERRSMDEQELASLLRAHGWSYIKRLRRNGTPYIYARKRKGAGIKERYIAPLSRLDRLTSEEVINKLQQGNGPNVAAATECVSLGRLSHSVA